MLKHLQKYFGGDAPLNAALVAEQPKEDVSMTDVTKPSGAQASAEVEAALQATVASLTEQLATATSKIAELTAVVEAAQEFKAAQEKAAAEAKAASRKAKLETAVGTEVAVALLAATAAMDDAGFEAVVAAMSSKLTTETNTPAFKEQGVDGQADATKVAAAGSRVMDYLKVVAKETQAE